MVNLKYFLVGILLILLILFFYPTKCDSNNVWEMCNCIGIKNTYCGKYQEGWCVELKTYCYGIKIYTSEEEVYPIATVKQQMIDQVKASGKIVDISRPIVDLRPNETNQVYIGFKNDKDYLKEFIIKVNDGVGSCNDIQTEYKTYASSVYGGDTLVMPINVRTGLSSTGSCLFQIEASYGSDLSNPEKIEIIDLTVNIVP